MLHHGQHHVPQIIHRMRKRALACAADEVHSRRIARARPMITGHGAGHGNIGEHRGELSVPVKSVCIVLQKAFTRSRPAFGVG